MSDWMKKIIIIISVIAVIIGAFFGVRAIVRAVHAKEQARMEREFANYSIENISIQVTDKESTIQHGYYSTKYKTVFSFSITNNCLKDIEYIEGKMIFYNGDEEFGSATVSFTSTIDSTRTAKMTVDFIGDSEVYLNLYSTPLSQMKIEYKITSVTFEEDETITYDLDYKVICVPKKKDEGSFNAIKECSIGQTVTFGKFETNCDFNTTEDIEWIVVKKQNGMVLLLSKMSLISMPFGDYTQSGYVSWKNSEIRKYLNGTFYYSCFTEEERSLMSATSITPSDEEIELGAIYTSDKIFIPSVEEMREFFNSEYDMICPSTGNHWHEGTDDGIGSISNDDFNDNCPYWLRDAIADYLYSTPGQSIFVCERFDNYTGFDATTSYNDIFYVRPCIWIDLSYINE